MSAHFTPSSEVEFLKMKRRLCGHLMGPNSYSGHGTEYENWNISIRNGKVDERGLPRDEF